MAPPSQYKASSFKLDLEQVIEDGETTLLEYETLRYHKQRHEPERYAPPRRSSTSRAPSRSLAIKDDNRQWEKVQEREQDRSPDRDWRIPSRLREGPSNERPSSSMPSFSPPPTLQDRGHSSHNNLRKPPVKTPKKQQSAESSIDKAPRIATPIAATSALNISNLADFFNPEVFHMVLHNPTTAHRFLRFCQARACGENIEFLQKLSAYNRLLEGMATALGAIHATFIQPGASKGLLIPNGLAADVSADLKEATMITLPSLESVFAGAQEYIEELLATDLYPRFVKHQITASATLAMATQRDRFSGLGDCFCITDPHIADNPIIYASDGFVSVTGYGRKEIIPRNCRFLQGKQTDPNAVKRLRFSIDQREETVELLLNYRKDGTPFWNLLYCAPLFDERGEVVFFLGGQVNCSTTIHSCTDVLKILSADDDDLDEVVGKESKPSIASLGQDRPKSSFFKSWKKFRPSAGKGSTAVQVKDEIGLEEALLNRVGKMTFKTQVEAFYTAYSKYLVLGYSDHTAQTLIIQHFSPGIIDMLGLNLPNGTIAPIHNKDIFFVLSNHSSSSSSTAKALKQTVRGALKAGKAVSVEVGLLTGFAEKKSSHAWFHSGRKEESMKRVEERYITHWTPVKGEDGIIKKVILTMAPRM